MRIAGLIGEPASGKTTLARHLLAQLSNGSKFKNGLVFGTFHEAERIAVFGSYDPAQPFAGTDRFSMAAQPAAEYWLRQFAMQRPDWTVFFEGDRLGNVKFFETCKSIGDLKIFVLGASDEELGRRHVQRGDTQTPTFLKSRRTKVANIVQALRESATLLENERQNHVETNLSTLLSYLRE